MSPKTPTVAALALLLVLASSPAFSINCNPGCRCNSPCSTKCFDLGDQLTCGIYGVCQGMCGAAAHPAAMSFVGPAKGDFATYLEDQGCGSRTASFTTPSRTEMSQVGARR